MKRLAILACSAALLVSFGAAAQEGTLKKIKDSGSITIGHRDASLPFSYYDDKAISGVYKSGQINAIYSKWFEKPVPPKNVNLALPMGAAFKKVVAKPTSSGDPKVYE